MTMTCTRLFLFLTIVTGLIYPLLITGLAHIGFPEKSSGQIIMREGTPVGSSLMGQEFRQDRYFHGRPSATEYRSAGATNLGPSHPNLAAVALDRERSGSPVPSDWVSASASGMDPHISPASASLQIPRVAETRNARPDAIKRLVDQHIEGPDLGFLGEPRVNVLLLNLDLDKEYPLP